MASGILRCAALCCIVLQLSSTNFRRARADEQAAAASTSSSTITQTSSGTTTTAAATSTGSSTTAAVLSTTQLSSTTDASTISSTADASTTQLIISTTDASTTQLNSTVDASTTQFNSTTDASTVSSTADASTTQPSSTADASTTQPSSTTLSTQADTDSSCDKSIVWTDMGPGWTSDSITFPVFLTMRKGYWPEDSWAYMDQCATTLEEEEFDAFCPPNEEPFYVKGLKLQLVDTIRTTENSTMFNELPAEFIVPCERVRQLRNTSQLPPAVSLRRLKHDAYRSTIRKLEVNLAKNAPNVFRCRDKFRHEQVPLHGQSNACEFWTYTDGSSSEGPDHALWTTNNYAELMATFQGFTDYNGTDIDDTADLHQHWWPIVMAGEDYCGVFSGYEVRGSNFSIFYEAHCVCADNATKCEPDRVHPLQGICPRASTIYMEARAGVIVDGFRTDGKRPISAMGSSPFHETCHAYILFSTTSQKTEIQIELGAHCPEEWLSMGDHECNQFVPSCYTVRPKHISIACCTYKYCDPAKEPSCVAVNGRNRTVDEQQSASGLMGLIVQYLVGDGTDTYPIEDGVSFKQPLLNQIGYCAHESNIYTDGYREQPPEHCYVFVDVKWRQFVNISDGWNFYPSYGEDVEKNFKGDCSCMMIHGTVRRYCPSLLNCTDELHGRELERCPPINHNDTRHTIVACRCKVNESNPWEFCDESFTVDSVLEQVERPQCMVGFARQLQNGSFDTSTLTTARQLNVLCYVGERRQSTQMDSRTNWPTSWEQDTVRQYGFYDPEEILRTGFVSSLSELRSMDCFPTDCTPDRRFCCCRTSKWPDSLPCNSPRIDLPKEHAVLQQLRQPVGMENNIMSRDKCEGDDSTARRHITSPQLLVDDFVGGGGMCYLTEDAHFEEATHEEANDTHPTEPKFYERPVNFDIALVKVQCNFKYWSAPDWLDGCSCVAIVLDGVWKESCCCIPTNNPKKMANVKVAMRTKKLRRFSHFEPEPT